jgi:subtilisin-like proprotein convertase family protein
LGFTGQVTLSASNLPTGVTVTFANNQVAAGSSANFTINASAAAASGTYVLNIVGTDGSQQEIQPITLVLRNVATVPVLQAPAANLQRTLPLPTFEWSAVPNATSYDLQVATDANFTNPIINQTGLTTNTFTATTALQQNGRYFWRVRSTAECGVGAWSAASPFAVGRIACTTYASTNVPATIGASSSENVLVPLTLSNVGAAAEIRVRNLSITHPNTGELIVSLLGPSGRSVTLATVPCNGSANLNANFDDAAASALTCPANLTPAGTYRPQDPLSVFRGLTADGQWTLLVRDIVAGNGGTVNSWSLDVCSVQDALSKREAQQMHGVSVFPNPSTGLFELNVDNAQRGTLQVRVTDAVGRVVLTQEITKGNGLLHHTLDLGKLSRGVYQLHLELPGGGSAVEKLMKL